MSHTGHFYVTKAKTFEIDQLRLYRIALQIGNKWFIEEEISTRERNHFIKFMLGGQKTLTKPNYHELIRWNPKNQLYFTFLLQKARIISKRNRREDVFRKYEKIFNMIRKGKPHTALLKEFGQRVIGDYAANGRNFKNIFEQLGLAWWPRNKWLHLTSTGANFIKEKKHNIDGLLRQIMEQQALKLQFSNPNIDRRYQHLRILPYPYLLSVLLSSEIGGELTRIEYALIVSRAKTNDEVDDIITRLKWFRKLSNKKKQKLMDKIKKIQHPDVGRPLFEEIYDSAQKEMSFFGSTGTISRVRIEGSKRLILKNIERAEEVIRLSEDMEYIEFRNEMDWFNYYGDWEEIPTLESAIDYYLAAGQVTHLKGMLTRLPPGSDLNVRALSAIREQDIENYFVNNLNLIEEGLSEYHSPFGVRGKQFPTEVGPIDCLCIDRSRLFVVIEFKRDRTADKAVGQILRYMGWVHENIGKHDTVRGIIVAGGADAKLKYAIKGLQYPLDKQLIRVKLHRFEISDLDTTLPPNS